MPSKKTKTKKLFLFSYETERGYWNLSKSFYESEEHFRTVHKMDDWVRIAKTNVSISVPQKTEKEIAFEAGLKAAEEKMKSPFELERKRLEEEIGRPLHNREIGDLKHKFRLVETFDPWGE